MISFTSFSWFGRFAGLVMIGAVVFAGSANCLQAAQISDDTKKCLSCHNKLTPGIVADWKKSRHSEISPSEAMQKSENEKRISATEFPGFSDKAVGCAECHMMNPDKHKDTFKHYGNQVHIIVTPNDCNECHPVEEKQFSKNLMANAHANLQDNAVYRTMVNSVNSFQPFDDKNPTYREADDLTNADSCLACHGTKVEVRDLKARKTAMGETKFPVLSGWPNQGVGRINPDGSRGACTACHTRHHFSIEVARKPYTCAQCHKGPDVPAYPVYMVSKHGNIFASINKQRNFDAVPWVVGRDFTAPTCAACHISLVTNKNGAIVAERSHQMNDRLPWRIFGLIYAHPHPKSPDTTVIRNKAGLPLPTDLTGELAEAFLITAEEQKARLEKMQELCTSCHSRQWVDGHFTKLDHTIENTNAITLEATKILFSAWEKGLAKGIAQGENIFDEAIEKKWTEQWLFYGNSTRFASAMGGADYGVFANGRWHQSKNLQEMKDYLKFLKTTQLEN
jgi:hypothetical protein